MAEQKANRRANGQFKPGYKPPTAWVKGESGNPNGRNGAMSDLFKDLAEAEDEQGKTRKEKILDKILKMAENGSLKAAEIYMNRVESKAREYVEQKIIKDEIIIE